MLVGPARTIVASITLGISLAQHAAAQETHWSFVAPVRPAVPAGAAGQSEIDAFVTARLQREGLQLSEEADRRTLIRRLSLDLNGLPPTPDEVATFVDDAGDDAYERLVDRLLARPSYGERMALRWLDLARYADTNGYSIDGGRHMWAWRDWVINAYNDNMPFDQFTIEQLAGDLLPDATTEQRIASGFNRNHMNTHEGGTIAEEYRVAYVADRVKTTAVTWMGLSMGCAQCHDHKYDPISQKDYYRFFAYFNTITDKGNDGNGGVNSVPFISVYSKQQRQRIRDLQLELQEAEQAILTPHAELDAAQQEWETEQAAIDHTPPTLGPWHVSGPHRAKSADIAFKTDYGPEAVVDLGAKKDGKPLWRPGKQYTDGKSHLLKAQNAATYFHRKITADRATTVQLSLGSDDAIRVWHDGALVIDKNVRRGVAPGQEKLTLPLRKGDNQLLVKIVNAGGPGGIYFKMTSSGLPEDVVSALAVARDQRTDGQRDVLLRFFRGTHPSLADERKAINDLKDQMRTIDAKPRTTAMVMEEQMRPRDTFFLVRGQYDVRGERVTAGTPPALPPLPKDAPNNRLGLARWLVDRSHPLTARVAVNGFWQMLFGTGLVKTSEDFGTQGEAPSHPELLDWLAVELIESGWDQKAMIKRIVMSKTYRQTSRTSDAASQRDPENRLLARGATFRLAAELIRDQALAVSGLLVRDVGGPSVRPYQPPGLWREMSHFGSTPATEQVYVQDTGDRLYRRSIYTIWKRTVPPPTMVAFDAPNRELCTPRRGRTNTPLQALVLLNETGFVEAARKLAMRMIRHSGTVEKRIDFGFRLVTGREPSNAERQVLAAAVTRETARYLADPAAAEELLDTGESPRDVGPRAADHAAWTIVANILLNLSETVTRS